MKTASCPDLINIAIIRLRRSSPLDMYHLLYINSYIWSKLNVMSPSKVCTLPLGVAAKQSGHK